MTANFEIEDNYAVRQNKKLFDLHNNFDLTGYHHDTQTKEFKIKWKKTTGDWVRADEASELEITHHGVSFLAITDKDESSNTEADKCLSEISFFSSDNRDINDSIVTQTTPTDRDDILYFFESGQLIRVCCDTVELRHS